MKLGAWLKLGNLISEWQIKVKGSFSKSWPSNFCSETFYKGYENLIQTPKYHN